MLHLLIPVDFRQNSAKIPPKFRKKPRTIARAVTKINA